VDTVRLLINRLFVRCFVEDICEMRYLKPRI